MPFCRIKYSSYLGTAIKPVLYTLKQLFASVSVNSGGYLPRRSGSVNIHHYSPPLRRIIVNYAHVEPELELQLWFIILVSSCTTLAHSVIHLHYCTICSRIPTTVDHWSVDWWGRQSHRFGLIQNAYSSPGSAGTGFHESTGTELPPSADVQQMLWRHHTQLRHFWPPPTGNQGQLKKQWTITVYTCTVNPFTPESDQCRNSPAASQEIWHHTVWRIWLFIAYSDEEVIILQILATSRIQLLFERLGEYTFWAQEWKG